MPFAGLMTQAPATTAKAMSPEMTASQVLAGANAPAPAQLNDDSASAKVGDKRGSVAAPQLAALRLAAKPELN